MGFLWSDAGIELIPKLSAASATHGMLFLAMVPMLRDMSQRMVSLLHILGGRPVKD